VEQYQFVQILLAL